MKNYKLELAYDGTRYYGWEHQPDRDTVQGRLESVLGRLQGSPVEVIGAGRTDAGVHARKMIAGVRLETVLSERELKDYMNRYLPEDISVLDVKEAGERFHARYKATGKLYRYTFYIGKEKPLFDRKYVEVLFEKPDTELMRKAAEYLVGTHDFTSFCGNTHFKKSAVRTVDRIEIVEKKDYLYLYFHGDGFLQNMVRIMTGTLLAVGNREFPPEKVKEILEGRGRYLAPSMVPAKGLCLMNVDYD